MCELLVNSLSLPLSLPLSPSPSLSPSLPLSVCVCARVRARVSSYLYICLLICLSSRLPSLHSPEASPSITSTSAFPSLPFLSNSHSHFYLLYGLIVSPILSSLPIYLSIPYMTELFRQSVIIDGSLYFFWKFERFNYLL